MDKKNIANLLAGMTILIDTREQEYRHITKYFESRKIPYRRHQLKVGDYSFMIEKSHSGWSEDIYFFDQICIERKNNIEELSQCLCQNRKRFINEFKRANGKIILLVENGCFSDIIYHRYNTQFNPKAFVGSLDTLQAEYDTHIEYVRDEKESGLVIYHKLYYWWRVFIKKYLVNKGKEEEEEEEKEEEEEEKPKIYMPSTKYDPYEYMNITSPSGE